MDATRPLLEDVSDDALLERLGALVRQSRCVESDLVAHIGEVDARRLYAREATSSMFAYCTEVLHLSESAAYLRILAARAAREYPILLAMLRDGRLHLSTIRRLAPHLGPLDDAARTRLLERATHQPKRVVEELVAELAPRPDVPATIRKLPRPRQVARDEPGGPSTPVSSPATTDDRARSRSTAARRRPPPSPGCRRTTTNWVRAKLLAPRCRPRDPPGCRRTTTNWGRGRVMKA